MRFVDTNVILYAYSTSPAEFAKRDIARSILGTQDWCISAQVLQEFYANATKPKRGAVALLTAIDALQTIQQLARFTTVAIDSAIVQHAIAISQRYQLSYWDSAIVAAAARSGANQLLSEDLNTGQVIEGVEVVNPFV